MNEKERKSLLERWEVREERNLREKNCRSYLAVDLLNEVQEQVEIKCYSFPGAAAKKKTTDREKLKQYTAWMSDSLIRGLEIQKKYSEHRNVIKCYEYEKTDDDDGIDVNITAVFENRISLVDMIKEERLPDHMIGQLAIDILGLLKEFSEQEIVHGDIKPSGIFFENGLFKLGDFRIAAYESDIMNNMKQKGTIVYMSPEVYNGEPRTCASDIYSFGIVLYRLLNDNRLPFLSEEDEPAGKEANKKAFEKRISGKLLPPPLFADDKVADILRRMCHPDPKERCCDAKQLLKEFCEAYDIHTEVFGEDSEAEREENTDNKKTYPNEDVSSGQTGTNDDADTNDLPENEVDENADVVADYLDETQESDIERNSCMEETADVSSEKSEKKVVQIPYSIVEDRKNETSVEQISPMNYQNPAVVAPSKKKFILPVLIIAGICVLIGAIIVLTAGRSEQEIVENTLFVKQASTDAEEQSFKISTDENGEYYCELDEYSMGSNNYAVVIEDEAIPIELNDNESKNFAVINDKSKENDSSADSKENETTISVIKPGEFTLCVDGKVDVKMSVKGVRLMNGDEEINQEETIVLDSVAKSAETVLNYEIYPAADPVGSWGITNESVSEYKRSSIRITPSSDDGMSGTIAFCDATPGVSRFAFQAAASHDGASFEPKSWNLVVGGMKAPENTSENILTGNSKSLSVRVCSGQIPDVKWVSENDSLCKLEGAPQTALETAEETEFADKFWYVSTQSYGASGSGGQNCKISASLEGSDPVSFDILITKPVVKEKATQSSSGTSKSNTSTSGSNRSYSSGKSTPKNTGGRKKVSSSGSSGNKGGGSGGGGNTPSSPGLPVMT